MSGVMNMEVHMARTPMSVLRRKQLRALELVRAGCSYDEVADDLGYASRGSAWRLVRSALDKEVVECAAEYRQLEADRLDAVQAAHWDAALAGDKDAAAVVLRAIDQRMRLFGLDRPAVSAAASSRTIFDLPANTQPGEGTAA